MSDTKHVTSYGEAAAQAVDPQAVSIPHLRAVVRGQVITPDDQAYDAARAVFYGGIDRHPAVVVRPADADDVAQVVLHARETGAELAVRSGGHSMAGHSATEGGIVLDLSAMKEIEINVEDRTAWAQAGMTAGEYTIATGAHGLATGFGDTGSVGIGGITLGGGVGFLVRKYGLTIDSLLAAEIVTADGQLVYTDEENHPDLFWAVRGGGGNFGVVTRFKFRLHKVDQVVGGMLILPASPELLLALMEEAEAAPEELSMIINVMVAPPMPFIPKSHHGQIITMVLPAYAGDIEAGQQAIERLRALATPIVDMVRPMPYTGLYPPEEAGEGMHPIAVGRNLFLDSFGQREANIIFEHLRTSTAMMAAAQLRVLGGAMARVPADATAFAHRSRRIMVNTAALYQNPEDAATHEAWVSEFAAALKQGEGGAYVNFVGSEGPDRVREAYPGATWDRLVAVKRRYDPTNLFRLNHNISPTAQDTP